MRAEATPSAWSPAQRKLHWTIALGVFLAPTLGFVMVRVDNSHHLLKFLLYQMHKNLGLIVLILASIRLFLRLKHGRPPYPPEYSSLLARLTNLGHAVLHGLLLAIPILGYLANSLSPSRIPILAFMILPLPNLLPPSTKEGAEAMALAHGYAAFVLLIVAIGHAGMAVWHHGQGSDILTKMKL